MKNKYTFAALILGVAISCGAQKATIGLNNYECGVTIWLPGDVIAPVDTVLTLWGNGVKVQNAADGSTGICMTEPGSFDTGAGIIPGAAGGSVVEFYFTTMLGSIEYRSRTWTQATGSWDDTKIPPAPASGPALNPGFQGFKFDVYIPDPYTAWAKATGLTARYPNSSAKGDDADRDGMSNYSEWQAGTDPTDPKSVLAMEIQARPNDLAEEDKTAVPETQHAIYFQSIPGKTYIIQTTDKLGASWQTVTILFPTTTPKRVLTNKPITRQAFYRVMVVP